jgi:hypothetical protein
VDFELPAPEDEFQAVVRACVDRGARRAKGDADVVVELQPAPESAGPFVVDVAQSGDLVFHELEAAPTWTARGDVALESDDCDPGIDVHVRRLDATATAAVAGSLQVDVTAPPGPECTVEIDVLE